LFFVWPQTTVRRVSFVTETTAPHFDPGRKPLITHTPRVTESADPAQKKKQKKKNKGNWLQNATQNAIEGCPTMANWPAFALAAQ